MGGEKSFVPLVSGLPPFVLRPSGDSIQIARRQYGPSWQMKSSTSLVREQKSVESQAGDFSNSGFDVSHLSPSKIRTISPVVLRSIRRQNVLNTFSGSEDC